MVYALFVASLITVAATSYSAAATALPAPGQRLVDYVATHSTDVDRRVLVGVSLEGGHVAVRDGVARTVGVTAVVRTRLRLTTKATFAAQRLCAIASVGVRRLGLRQVATVEVHARSGDTGADSLVVGLPSCHRWTVSDGQTYP